MNTEVLMSVTQSCPSSRSRRYNVFVLRPKLFLSLLLCAILGTPLSFWYPLLADLDNGFRNSHEKANNGIFLSILLLVDKTRVSSISAVTYLFTLPLIINSSISIAIKAGQNLNSKPPQTVNQKFSEKEPSMGCTPSRPSQPYGRDYEERRARAIREGYACQRAGGRIAREAPKRPNRRSVPPQMYANMTGAFDAHSRSYY